MPNQRRHSILALSAKERTAPTEVRLFKHGENESDYGPLLFDDIAAQLVMDKYERKGVDLMIDYEHASLAPLMTASGKAKAAGWFKPEVRDGELWATDIKWTDTARAEIEAAEYRYISPCVDFDWETTRVTGLVNFALTNSPATHDLEALVAASAAMGSGNPSKETTMDPKDTRIAELERQAAAKDEEIKGLKGQTNVMALSAAVGLPPTATMDDVRKVAAEDHAFKREVLSLVGKDSPTLALGALTALKEQAAKVVELTTRIEASETAALSAEWKSYLDTLVTAGKDGKVLPPANRVVAEKLALSLGAGKLTKDGVEGAKEYVATMMVVASGSTAASGSDAANPPPGAPLSLSQADMLKRMGSDRPAFEEWRKKDLLRQQTLNAQR